jgi:DNA-directed RNA polymerase specialized sigma24 family protein
LSGHVARLSIEETAEALGVSESTVKRGWLSAKASIRHRVAGRSNDHDA